MHTHSQGLRGTPGLNPQAGASTCFQTMHEHSHPTVSSAAYWPSQTTKCSLMMLTLMKPLQMGSVSKCKSSDCAGRKRDTSPDIFMEKKSPLYCSPQSKEFPLLHLPLCSHLFNAKRLHWWGPPLSHKKPTPIFFFKFAIVMKSGACLFKYF